ncbi:hypothetical protein C2845_PM16G14270 [Panicum miliaceum]|uniref:Uncharacterized protein n=1 Tax=Panicum miliaceum TaxID=4540 RepID=A0A3L6PUA9_PANMI|nr:hypothetical protein C2845_PM16G14270 [Panicum miliaceum]
MAGTALGTYGRDMTAAAGEMDPVIGRDGEIDQVVCTLCRRTKNNAMLVGAPGVGKTAIAEGLAQRIAGGMIPAFLAGARVVELDLGALVAGTSLRGMLEERIKKVIREAEDAGGRTFDEYRKYIEKDAALERRFQIVHVEEPSTDATIQILQGLKRRYEAHHGLTIMDSTIAAATQLAARYITGCQFPDKAIDLIDQACATRRIQIDKQKKVNASREVVAKRERATVCPEHVAQVLSRWTDIPVDAIDEKEKDKLIHLADKLHKRVVGQDEAVNLVAQAVLRTRAGFDKCGQPIGCFLFLGSTGLGKTELAKALAEQLFDNEKMLIRLDMSEFAGTGSVSRLIGAPPSYIGYEDGGQLTEKVRRRPYSVILFDEVEKADPSVFNAILQLLDDGVLTDGKGRTVDFKNTLIIMTSNLGAEHLAEGMAGKETMEAARDLVMKQVHKHFKPEFLNRLSDVVIFEPLSRDKLKEVVRIHMKSIIANVADKGISLSVSDAALDVMFSESYYPMYGARPIRWVQKNVMTKLSEMLINGEVDEGSTICIDATEDKKALKYEATKMTTNKLQDESDVLEIATDSDDDVAEVLPQLPDLLELRFVVVIATGVMGLGTIAC